MPRLLITNGLGKTKIISKDSLQKQKDDYEFLKKTVLCDPFITDSHRRELEAQWTIVTVEEIE